jgi:hypothetical protein
MSDKWKTELKGLRGAAKHYAKQFGDPIAEEAD